MNKKLPKCPNCKKAMVKIDGLWALTGVKQEEEKEVLFDPSKGIPAVVFHCPKCGELKLFSAVILGEIKV